jgi:hypothetical protein
MLKKIPTSSKAIQTSDFCFENSRKHLPIGMTEKITFVVEPNQLVEHRIQIIVFT